MTKPQPDARSLGLLELVAIALGGMIGGGIFSILGVAVERVGDDAPVAIALGGCLALVAGIPYARLTRLYEDEGATYSFFKRTFPGSPVAASVIGWLVVFGYVATLGLYSLTFASYLGSLLPSLDGTTALLSGAQLSVFAVLNITSVRLMGRIEDAMVYVKLVALLGLAMVLFWNGTPSAPPVPTSAGDFGDLLLVAAMTFVAFEGFQLAIHAYQEAESPRKNIPRAIYVAIAAAAVLYVLLSQGALWALDKDAIIADKEYALAAGAAAVLGPAGHAIVIASALLATSSAVNGTLFGASRLAAIIADDGFMPRWLAARRGHVPYASLLALAGAAWMLVLSGSLDLIVEFGSLIFIVVSMLMAVANWRVRKQTGSSLIFSVGSTLILAAAAVAIVVWQATDRPYDLAATLVVGLGLATASVLFARRARPA